MVGFGVGSAQNNGVYAGTVSLNAQGAKRILALRWDGENSGNDDKTDAFSLTMGRVMTRPAARGFAELSAGLSAVRRQKCLTNCGIFRSGPATTEWSTVGGLALAGDVAWRFGRKAGVGAGLSSFANLNSAESFIAVAVTLSAGRWR